MTETANGETYTFVSENKVFKTTIKSEFLKTCPNPEAVPFHELMSQYNMANYLHNPTGPAIHVLKNGYEEYWLDGKQVSEEVKNKIIHDTKFSDELEDFLNK